MNIFVTLQEGKLRDDFFPNSIMDQLNKIGCVRFNHYGRVMNEKELSEELKDIEVCIVLAWSGCPKFTKEVLERSPKLKLIVTPGGSVAPFITDSVYERNIKICSANNIMARYVAEGTLTYMLTALREVPRRNNDIKKGIWGSIEGGSLINARVGLVGMGAVGRHLIDFLEAFEVELRIYDPYLKKENIPQHKNIKICSLDEVLSESDIVSIHASRTDETYRMINKEKLALLKDGTLLINTARGALIDEEALTEELKTGRIHAVLDVFEIEPLPEYSELKQLDNVILMPHTAGLIHVQNLTLAMLEEIKRYSSNSPLIHEIPFEKYKLMTR